MKEEWEYVFEKGLNDFLVVVKTLQKPAKPLHTDLEVCVCLCVCIYIYVQRCDGSGKVSQKCGYMKVSQKCGLCT
jgi:hypothetical protein